MAETNALIGVQTAAYYPDVTLSALYGFVGSPVESLIQTANRVWSLGASASQTLFEGGARSAAVEAAQAAYDQSVATYRQTVLTAFQQVEDQLSTLRILQQQAVVQEQAVLLARQAVQISLNEYRAGTVAYNTVVTSQAAALSDEQTALSLQAQRLQAECYADRRPGRRLGPSQPTVKEQASWRAESSTCRWRWRTRSWPTHPATSRRSSTPITGRRPPMSSGSFRACASRTCPTARAGRSNGCRLSTHNGTHLDAP